MSDRFFFPLALLIGVLMAVFSIRIGTGSLPSGTVSGAGTDYVTIQVAGNELNRMEAGGEVGLGIVDRPEGPVLRIETAADVLSDDPLRGPHFVLDSDMENVFQGSTIRITMRVKPSERYGAMKFMANYSTGKVGESGWQEFDLMPDYKDYSFEYDVPLRPDPNENGYDYLAIRPVTPEKTRAIEIASVTFTRLDRWAPQP